MRLSCGLSANWHRHVWTREPQHTAIATADQASAGLGGGLRRPLQLAVEPDFRFAAVDAGSAVRDVVARSADKQAGTVPVVE